MCHEEGRSLQKGMNFRTGPRGTVVLMSLRRNAPYADRIEEDGKILIYEGHDQPKSSIQFAPKSVDQIAKTPRGGYTENGLFFEAAKDAKAGRRPPELVRVYEKIRPGIWVFNGNFELVDAWLEEWNGRKVFKFKLTTATNGPDEVLEHKLEYNSGRLIPTDIKLEVWRRDKGQCTICGSRENLHFDHIIPYSRGGSSSVAKNIQILCAKHNLEKHDRIE